MTQTLKNMLTGAKSVDEAYEILCANSSQISMNEQIKIYLLASGKSELSDDELDMVVGGSIFGSIKKGLSKACDKAVNWCENHKRELIIAACVVGGIAIGMTGIGIGFATGAIGITAAAPAAATITGYAAGAIIGGFAGFITGCYVAASECKD